MIAEAQHEPDPDKRLADYRQIATYVRDEAFALPIANYVLPYALRSNVHGVVRQPISNNPSLEEAWLS